MLWIKMVGRSNRSIILVDGWNEKNKIKIKIIGATN
jgi:hypothetical protein